MKMVLGFLVGYALGEIGLRVAGPIGILVSLFVALPIALQIDKKWKS